MPPRKRISNIAKLLPRKRTSTPEAPTTRTVPVHRDCTSLPAGLGADFDERLVKLVGASFTATQTSGSSGEVIENEYTLSPHDLRVHRFAQRYESNQLPSYRDYPPVEEDATPQSDNPCRSSLTHSPLTHSSELQPIPDREPDPVSEPEPLPSPEPQTDFSHCSCDLSSLKHELSLLRENHQLLSETTRETLRLAEVLESRVESLQSGARPSQRLFWMLLDSLAAVVLFLFTLLMKPWLMARRCFVTDRATKRRSWRLSVGDFENDPFLGDVAKRLSFSAVHDDD